MPYLSTLFRIGPFTSQNSNKKNETCFWIKFWNRKNHIFCINFSWHRRKNLEEETGTQRYKTFLKNLILQCQTNKWKKQKLIQSKELRNIKLFWQGKIIFWTSKIIVKREISSNITPWSYKITKNLVPIYHLKTNNYFSVTDVKWIF